MAPFFTGIAKGLGGTGFGSSRKKSRPKGRYLTVPDAVNAPLSWNLDADGPLTLNGPAKHTITAGTPEREWSGTISVAMWGAGAPGSHPNGAVGGGGGGSFGTITLNDGNNYIMVSGHASPLGGGGYSGIFQTSETQANAWMIAGGGGQGGSNGAAGASGGDGGGTTGAAGGDNGYVTGGGGGSQVAGGSAGSPAYPNFYPATAGGALGGGNGANGDPRGSYPNVQPLGPGGGGQLGSNLNSWGSGGGGGGYFGGGGGGRGSFVGDPGLYGPSAGPAAAGGGGSGYINPTYVTGGNTYPYSTPTSINHPLRGTAGRGASPAGGAVAGKIVLT